VCPRSYPLFAAMLQSRQSAKMMAVACVGAVVGPCFIQPLNPTSLAPRRLSQAKLGLNGLEDNHISGGVLSGAASGFTLVTAVLACGRLACSRNRQPMIARKFMGGGGGLQNELGAQPPLGFWDPVGFVSGEGAKDFRKYREAEIKHGRLAMMAAVGLLVQSLTRISGFEAVPGGIEAAWFPAEQVQNSLAFILVLIAGLETSVFVQDPNKEPGNFGDPLNLGDYSFESRGRELNNGRAGMSAFATIAVINLLNGQSAGQQLGLL